MTAYLVQEALGLWRERPHGRPGGRETGRVDAARLEGLRMDAENPWMEAETWAGHARDVLETARALMAKASLPERRWALLAKALHQIGREAEALAALKQTRARVEPARSSFGIRSLRATGGRSTRRAYR